MYDRTKAKYYGESESCGMNDDANTKQNDECWEMRDGTKTEI